MHAKAAAMYLAHVCVNLASSASSKMRKLFCIQYRHLEHALEQRALLQLLFFVTCYDGLPFFYLFGSVKQLVFISRAPSCPYKKCPAAALQTMQRAAAVSFYGRCQKMSSMITTICCVVALLVHHARPGPSLST